MPIVGRTIQELAERAAYFKVELERQKTLPAMQGLGLICHAHIHEVMAHINFAIMGAYKKKYSKNGSRTDSPKRAAIVCATIAATNPLRPPLSLNDIDKEEYLYANPMLAMRLASSIVDHPFRKRTMDDQRRVYREISGFSFPCVDGILVEARKNNGIVVSNWDIELSTDEEAKINALVEQFTIYLLLKIPEQTNR